MIWIAWFGLAIVAGAVAEHKGRSGVGFFALALALSPLVGLIAAALAQRNPAALDARALSAGAARRCPACAELVRPAARVCRHCGGALAPAAPPPPLPWHRDPTVRTVLLLAVLAALLAYAIATG